MNKIAFILLIFILCGLTLCQEKSAKTEKASFDSPTDMPYTFINLRTGEKSGATTNPAEIGTLILEFGALSKISRNMLIYYLRRNRL